MLRIIDRTLSCLDGFSPRRGDLSRLLKLLIRAGADVIELSERAYKSVEELPPGADYVLRLEEPENAALFPEFSAFIVSRADVPGAPPGVDPDAIIPEWSYGDLSAAAGKRARVLVPDAMFADCLDETFAGLSSPFRKIEFCPRDILGCAVAMAVEWVMSGRGEEVVTSLGGVGRFAPFEEVALSMRVLCGKKDGQTFEMFPEMRDVLERVTGVPVGRRKAALGDGIFDVESGIHVDGILKDPAIYEPFPPELVGGVRRILIGRHSGRKAVMDALGRIGKGVYSPSGVDEERLLQAVRRRSALKNAALCESDLLEAAESLGNE